MEEIEQKLIEIIGEYTDVDAKKIDIDMSLKFDAGLDSFGLISLICAIENEFNISIPDDKLMSFNTLREMAEFIQTAQN